MRRREWAWIGSNGVVIGTLEGDIFRNKVGRLIPSPRKTEKRLVAKTYLHLQKQMVQ